MAVDPFTHHFRSDTATMDVELVKGFTSDNFETLVQFYQDRVNKGVLHWDVSLRNLEIINSVGLGVLVAFNAAVASRGGKLRLILRKDSKITSLLQLTKLDKIISCVIT